MTPSHIEMKFSNLVNKIPDINILNFIFINSIIFYSYSVFGKLMEVLSLINNGLLPDFSLLDLIKLFEQDLYVSIIFFSFLYALRYFTIKHGIRNQFLIIFILLFQAIHTLFIIISYEFFGYFKAQLSFSHLLQSNLLIKIVYPTLLTISNSIDLLLFSTTFIIGFMIVLSSIILGKIKYKVSWKKIESLSIIIVIFFFSTIALPQLLNTNPVFDEYNLYRNFLHRFLVSMYHRYVYYIDIDLHIEPANGLIDNNPLTDEYFIDKDYPLMKGSLYSICQNHHLSDSDKFYKLCRQDRDNDGFNNIYDCDDRNPLVNTHAIEVKNNGFDENCDIFDDPPMNVLFVILESVVTKDLGVYGNKVKNTPNLAVYRNISFISKNFYANSATSFRGELMSYCSLFPYENFWAFSSPGYTKVPCIFDILSDRGYKTGYFISSDSGFGDLREFISSRDSWDMLKDKNDMQTTGFHQHMWGVEDKVLVKPFFEWIDTDKKTPFFGVLRTTTGHEPLSITEKFKKYDNDRKNLGLYIDSFIGNIVRGMRKRKLLDNTLIVIVSDHTKEYTSIPGKIPFIMINPVLFKNGVVSKKPASQIDITPTILNLLNIKEINSFQGEDFLKSAGSAKRIYFTSIHGLIGFREGKHLYVHNTNNGERHLSASGIDITGQSSDLINEYDADLIAWQKMSKRLYLEDRLFYSGLNMTSVKTVSTQGCWDMRNTTLDYNWAVKASSSSSFGTSGNSWSSEQATGEPDVIGCYDSTSAWAPNSKDSVPQWLELYFDVPVFAESLVVCETFNSPFIQKIFLIDVDEGYHTLWAGKDTTECPGMFKLDFKPSKYLVKGVRIITKDYNSDYEEIDAVGIKGSSCDSLMDLADKDDCYFSVGEYTKNTLYCNLINDVITRDLCLLEISLTTVGPKKCSLITDSYLKRLCSRKNFRKTA